MNNFFSDFKKFINRGNIFEMAVGIIIGAAFTKVVNSLANDLILPIISSWLRFDLSTGVVVLVEATEDKAAITLNYGIFIQNVITFFVIAFSVFLTIRVFNHIKKKAIDRKVAYVLNLKAKHPELFDEEGEVGTVMYEKLKKSHPEYFLTKEAKSIAKSEEKDIYHEQLDTLNNIYDSLNRLAESCEKLDSKNNSNNKQNNKKKHKK